MKTLKTMSILMAGILAALSITCGCGGSSKPAETKPAETKLVETTITETEAPETEAPESTEIPGFGSTIVFDDLEITIGSGYSFTAVENEFSEHNGADVIELPVHVKNIGDENNSLNFFMYKFFGSRGTELDSVSSYFDNDIDEAGELRPGAEYDTFFHILYDGDGTYCLSLDDILTKEEIEFGIIK